MRVEILYFGVLRETVGVSEKTVELKEGATVGELIRMLRGQASNPLQAGSSQADSLQADPSQDSRVDETVWRSLAVAVNREYASLSVVLHDGDEVALLPPVSGGSCAEGEKRASLASTRSIAGSSRCSRVRSGRTG